MSIYLLNSVIVAIKIKIRSEVKIKYYPLVTIPGVACEEFNFSNIYTSTFDDIAQNVDKYQF